MKTLLAGMFFWAASANGQFIYTAASFAEIEQNATAIKIEEVPDAYESRLPLFARKLYQRNTGMILGLQKGKYTNLELGGEAHWRKISLLKPYIYGATANLEYNFEENVLGYKAGLWMKRGRINLTYGANVNYYTDFNDGNRFGFGPSIGFRLFGLHLVNGYTFFTGSGKSNAETSVAANPLYMSLRYYFPVHNKFTWDRATMKRKKERQKERAKRKKERQKKRESGERKSVLDLFRKKD